LSRGFAIMHKCLENGVLKIFIDVEHRFNAKLFSGEKLIKYCENDIVPQFMPGKHCGKYLILEIDINNGKILNWQVPTGEDLFYEMECG